MTKPILTQAILKELLHYDPETGIFTWRGRERNFFKTEQIFKMWKTRYLGRAAGGKNSEGYLLITLFGKSFPAHRLAFLYMTGKFPSDQTDHINGIRDDNRWANLRSVTGKDNSRNQKIRSDNTSGHIGVCWHEIEKKWKAQIGMNGKSMHLGTFTSKKDAIIARGLAEVKHGFHPNHGRVAI